MSITGADPGFPVGGGANPRGGGRQHMILPNFEKNCMKLRKFLTVGGAHAGSAPLNLPLDQTNWFHRGIIIYTNVCGHID